MSNHSLENANKPRVKVLVVTGFGLNCEVETSAAFRYCGADVDRVHLNDVLSENNVLDEYHILAFIGGFSFGDHLGAGTVFANRVKYGLKEDIQKFIDAGKLIIGICNGFQTLTRLGLLPAIDGKYFEQQVALAHNDSGVFRDDWIKLKGNDQSPCIFTKGIERIELPIRHGEGKFIADDEIVADLESHNLVALRYADDSWEDASGFPENPNGSINNVAAISDISGRIFGLMPHPEAFLSPYNHPAWMSQKKTGKLPKEGQGVIIFMNAVDYATKNLLKG